MGGIYFMPNDPICHPSGAWKWVEKILLGTFEKVVKPGGCWGTLKLLVREMLKFRSFGWCVFGGQNLENQNHKHIRKIDWKMISIVVALIW